MNIMNKLTLRHMKMNKGRTIVTTIGIAASVALITAIFVSLASFFDMEGQLCLYSDGNCQARVSQISREQQQQLQNNRKTAYTRLAISTSKNYNRQIQRRKCKKI